MTEGLCERCRRKFLKIFPFIWIFSVLRLIHSGILWKLFLTAEIYSISKVWSNFECNSLFAERNTTIRIIESRVLLFQHFHLLCCCIFQIHVYNKTREYVYGALPPSKFGWVYNSSCSRFLTEWHWIQGAGDKRWLERWKKVEVMREGNGDRSVTGNVRLSK